MNELFTIVFNVISFCIQIAVSFIIYFLNKQKAISISNLPIKQEKYKQYKEFINYLSEINIDKEDPNKIFTNIKQQITATENIDYFSFSLKKSLSRFKIKNKEVFKIQYMIFYKKIILEFEQLKYKLGYESHYQTENYCMSLIIYCIITIFVLTFIIEISVNKIPINIIIIFCVTSIILIICLIKIFFFSYTSRTAFQMRKLQLKLINLQLKLSKKDITIKKFLHLNK